MPGLGFFGSKAWKFRFPKAENVGLDAHDFANFGDLEKELIGNLC
jgi:hypothetical protein